MAQRIRVGKRISSLRTMRCTCTPWWKSADEWEVLLPHEAEGKMCKERRIWFQISPTLTYPREFRKFRFGHDQPESAARQACAQCLPKRGRTSSSGVFWEVGDCLPFLNMKKLRSERSRSQDFSVVSWELNPSLVTLFLWYPSLSTISLFPRQNALWVQLDFFHVI